MVTGEFSSPQLGPKFLGSMWCAMLKLTKNVTTRI